MINPADFMIIEDDIKGLLSPNGKKYYLSTTSLMI